MIVRFLIGCCLLFAFVIWLAEKRIRRGLGLSTGENCATWAAEHFDYDGGDGLVFHRTVSDSWLRFPHVAIMRGARQAERNAIELVEFVPKVRNMGKQIPPRHFDGIVKRRRYFVADHQNTGD